MIYCLFLFWVRRKKETDNDVWTMALATLQMLTNNFDIHPHTHKLNVCIFLLVLFAFGWVVVVSLEEEKHTNVINRTIAYKTTFTSP